ncbi:hypothetical protein Acr_16g0009980 [Actinidia rufa]|uniref:Uncharacterized protein n=1 Tax=Actinidia rufa TaxID=165716 RepID=A0A7J0G0M3_9ERIC|nr:hypothetical protein Acr_16g0009980 [Actinidia rufa]
MSAATCNHPVRPNGISTSSSRFSRPISIPNRRSHLGLINSHGRRSSRSISAKASLSSSSPSPSPSSSSPSPSPWDDKPYEVLRGGRKVYLDEQDVVAFLDPPKYLVPLDPASFNPAAYLWKKIEDVPEERRINLLFLIKPRLISRAWALAGTRYEDPKLLKKSASSLLSSNGDGVQSPEFWNCRTSGVKQVNEVMSTEQPCDLAYEFGDGLLDIHEYPPGFPRAAKHPWPFNDEVVIYIRYLGPGVMVGQAWQEGESLEKLPQKLCGEILMVKDYAACENK